MKLQFTTDSMFPPSVLDITADTAAPTVELRCLKVLLNMKASASYSATIPSVKMYVECQMFFYTFDDSMTMTDSEFPSSNLDSKFDA